MRRNSPHFGFQSQRYLVGWLLACAATCSHSADLQSEIEALQAFDQARTEINSQRYDRAEILLERVLMLHPENAEARIELAMLLARRGHNDGAQALVQSLLDDPRTEPDQSKALAALLQSMKKGRDSQVNPYALGTREAYANKNPLSPISQPEVGRALWRGEASFSASSNPLARTSTEAITITLPDGPLTLPLSQKAQAGTLVGTSLSLTDATYGAELSVQHANVSDATNATRAVLWHQLPLQQWLPGTGTSWQPPPVLGYLQSLRGLDGQSRTTVGLTTQIGSNQLLLSSYKDNSLNDHGTAMRAEHKPARWMGTDWLASIEYSASGVKPQAYWRTQLSAAHPLGNGRKLSLQMAHQQDTYSYSALLQDGAHRRLTSIHVAFEQQTQLKNGKVLIWRLFSAERRSNLELFSYNEIGAQLSLMQNWR